MADTATAAEIAAPVLIVGGGPVGMTLAMQLDALGIPCVIVNSDPDARWHPKGATQNARTMEHYRRLGVSPALRRLGLPADWPTDVGYFTRLVGWELARLKMPSECEKMEAVANAAPTDQVPEPLLRANQMYVEAWLLRHLGKLDQVTVRYGWQCLDYAEDAAGAVAEIEEIETGRRERVRAQYVVGCDGGRGLVRHKLGIRYSSAEPAGPRAYLNGPQVSTYVRIPGFFARIRHPRCWFYWVVNADLRSALMVLDGSDDFSFGTVLARPEDKPDPAIIAQKLRASVGAEIEFAFHDHKPWTAGHALVADSFGAGRTILCGDAAHLFTPTGGFGLNTGIDDAVNLAWKLAALVQGWGGPKLLASYESERRPIAFRNTSAGKQWARSVGAVRVAPAIDEDGPAGDAARREAGAVLSDFGEEFAMLGVQLGARYDGSPLVAAEGAAPPADDPVTYRPSACPGGRAPHLWLEGKTSLYDRLGPFFTLLRFKGASADPRPLAAAARARNLPLAILDVALDAGRDLYERDLALIRPDQHVAWRGNRLPEDCDALLAQITGF
jgi:2-polyprenyl-6-methoxyphenol hydroxylase-like FAD-dependent oxidoreductase